jgi:RNA polymerase sigma-70 factor (ECF subfamily)
MQPVTAEQAEGGSHEQDNQCVERLKQGDMRAFTEIAERYQKPLFRYAYAFFHNREDALEIVQETLMRLVEKIDLYQPGHSLQSWLFRIARNLCIDHYRRHKKHMQVQPLDTIAERDMSYTPEQAAHDQERQRAIQAGCAALPERQRAVFLLKHQQGMKLNAIAATMKLTLGTVKTLHHRAIKNIRKHVQRAEGGVA